MVQEQGLLPSKPGPAGPTMKTVAAPIDTRVRDAYVKILLRIEEENGEKIINYAWSCFIK